MLAPPLGHGPGARVGAYVLGECIGRGGVAEVHRAHADGGLRRAVVVKRIRDELRHEPAVREAFVREAILARRLHHGNIVQVLDLVEHDGAPCIVMELVDGVSLQRLFDHGASIGLPAALHVVEQVAAALQYVHDACDDDGAPLGLVHRDVTPANVLLGCDGVVKLTDFGIARAAALGNDTLPGFIKGTARYLAPEQAAGRPVDRRADVFALGLVLRRMLVGDRGTDAVPHELVAIVDAATEPAMRDRTPSAEALLSAVQRYRSAAGIDGGAAMLAALVDAARGRAAPRAIALGHALAAEGPHTRQVAAVARPLATARMPWRILLGASVLVGLGAIAALAWPPAQGPRVATSAGTRDDATVEPASVPAEVALTPVPARDPIPESIPESTSAPLDPVTLPAPAGRPPPRRADVPAPARVRGRLLVNVVPYAEVTIDGRRVGTTPLDRPLPTGKHTVELYNPDTLRRRSLRVTIAADAPVNITHW